MKNDLRDQSGVNGIDSSNSGSLVYTDLLIGIKSPDENPLIISLCALSVENTIVFFPGIYQENISYLIENQTIIKLIEQCLNQESNIIESPTKISQTEPVSGIELLKIGTSVLIKLKLRPMGLKDLKLILNTSVLDIRIVLHFAARINLKGKDLLGIGIFLMKVIPQFTISDQLLFESGEHEVLIKASFQGEPQLKDFVLLEDQLRDLDDQAILTKDNKAFKVTINDDYGLSINSTNHNEAFRFKKVIVNFIRQNHSLLSRVIQSLFTLVLAKDNILVNNDILDSSIVQANQKNSESDFLVVIHNKKGVIYSVSGNWHPGKRVLEKEMNFFNYLKTAGKEYHFLSENYYVQSKHELVSNERLVYVSIDKVVYDEKVLTLSLFRVNAVNKDAKNPGIEDELIVFKEVTKQLVNWTYVFKIQPGAHSIDLIWYDNFDPKEYIYHDAKDFFDLEKYINAVHPDDIDIVMNKIGNIARGSTFVCEYRILSSNNDYFWIRDNIWFIKAIPGEGFLFYGTIKNVDEHLKQQNELKLLKQAIDQTSNLILILDRELRIEYANTAVSDKLGHAYQDLDGKKLLEVFKLSLNDDSINEYLSQLHSGNKVIDKIRLKKQKGMDLVLQIHISPFLNLKDVPSKYIVVIQDITEQEELEQRMTELDKAQIISRLTQGVSHDFNNILQIIGTFAELLERRYAHDEKGLGYIKTIFEAKDKGRDLVSSLMAYGKSNELPHQKYNIRDLVDGCKLLLKGIIPKRIQFSIDTESSAILSTNPILFNQILMNLVMNAVQAIDDKGSITIKINNVKKTDTNKVSGEECVEIIVSDTGKGIPVENLERVTDPYFSTKEEIGGTGLGLAIVKKIIVEMNGSLFIESNVFKGTSVIIRLPAAN